MNNEESENYKLTERICIECGELFGFKYTPNGGHTEGICSEECYNLHFKEKLGKN